MKGILLVIAAILSLHCAKSPAEIYLFCHFKGNGDGLHYAWSRDGYSWQPMFSDSVLLKPTVSRDKLMRDPCIIRGADGLFHMVWTVSWNDKGIGYSTSPDLFNWSEQRFLPVMAHEDSARNTWAPEITYDEKNREYMIYWASTISGRYPNKDTAAESKYNHRMYYATTKDFKDFSPTQLLFDPGFSVIDASIIKHEDEYVMFLKNETRWPVEKNIRIAYAKELKGPYSAAGPPITGNYWAEGPTALHTGDKWIIYFDKYRDRKYGAVASTDLKQWQDISDKVTFPKGARHGTVLVITEKEFNKLRSFEKL